MYKQSNPMLNASEQINYLKNKGVKFELISESDAENYLKINNNYFKLWTAPQMLDKKCLIFGGAFFMGRYPDEVKLAVIKYCVDESHSIN